MSISYYKKSGDFSLRLPLSNAIKGLLAPRSFIKGLDINRNQAGQLVDAKKIAEAGYKFAILEAAWGLMEPQSFKTFWPPLLDAGIVLLAYGFFRGDEDGSDQADFLLNTTQRMFEAQGFMMPLASDVEPWANDSSTLNQRITGWRDWVNAIQRTITAMVYSNLPSWKSQVNNELLPAGCLGWAAHYTNSTYPMLAENWTQEGTPFHQFGIAPIYSWCPQVPGMSSDVSVDRFYGTLEQLLALGSGNVPEPPPEPEPEEDMDLTKVKAVRDSLVEIYTKADVAATLLNEFITEHEDEPEPPPPPPPTPPPSNTWTMTLKEKTHAFCFEVWNETQGKLIEKRNGAGLPIIQDYRSQGRSLMVFAKGVQVQTYKTLTNADGAIDYYELYNQRGDRGQRLFLAKDKLQKPS